MDNISTHISFNEAIFSSTGIRLGIGNIPNEQQIERMKMWADKVFEPTRLFVSQIRKIDTPLNINSLFRCVALNKAIGGSDTSSHCAGEKSGIDEAAGDIEAHYPDFNNKDLFLLIKEKGAFDQLIWEFDDPSDKAQPAWVHVGFRKRDNRMQVLRATRENGITKYIPFV